ncbi:MAG: DUF4424 family protein [Candidatus Zixiibacteriota bacterium]
MQHLKVPLAVLFSFALSILLLLFPPLQSGTAVKPSIEAEPLDRGVDFVYEKIIIEIEPPELTVTGLYRFQNRFPFEVTLPMLYPLPVDEYQDFPHQISAKSISADGKQPLEFAWRRNNNAIRLNVSAEGKSSTEMRVTYSQRLKGKQARYILTTTKAWGKPLKSADHQLILSENLKISSISFPFDRAENIAGKRVYFSYKENFLPDTDLIVTWE